MRAPLTGYVSVVTDDRKDDVSRHREAQPFKGPKENASRAEWAFSVPGIAQFAKNATKQNYYGEGANDHRVVREYIDNKKDGDNQNQATNRNGDLFPVAGSNAHPPTAISQSRGCPGTSP